MVEHTRSQQVVLWAIWLGMLSSVVVVQLFLGGGLPKLSSFKTIDYHPVAILAVGQVLIATVVRWVPLRRAGTTGEVLVCMVIGLALSEAVTVHGCFLVPDELVGLRAVFWLMSVVSVIQFAPVYARKPRPQSPFRTE